MNRGERGGGVGGGRRRFPSRRFSSERPDGSAFADRGAEERIVAPAPFQPFCPLGVSPRDSPFVRQMLPRDGEPGVRKTLLLGVGPASSRE